MYLSRIELDYTRRETQKALIALSHFHGAVEGAFSGEKRRKLWRIDMLRGKRYLLILSEEIPDFTNIQQQFGYAEKEGESLNYEKLLNRVTEGSVWRYKLTANPSYAKKKKEDRGKVCSEVSQKYMFEWIEKRAENNGFELVENQTEIQDVRWCAFSKKGEMQVQFKAVTYEGLLVVKDSQRMKEALINGIGREKAYGMGLITLIKV